MTSRFPVARRIGLLSLAAALLAGPAIAQETRKKAEQPLITINAASVERLMTDVEYAFKAADKPEMLDVIKGLLGNVNDLKGVDRKKPFGVMFFLVPDLPPSFSGVGFLPVSDLEEIVKTFSVGPFALKKVEDKEGHFEIVGPRRTFPVVLKNGYLFMSDKAENLDRELPDPVKAGKALATKYDLAVRVNINAVPRATRRLLTSMLRGSTEARLQQRDDEPDAIYEFRKAQGLRDMQFIEGLLLDGEELLLGLDASPRDKQLMIEAKLQAKRGSDFVKLLRDFGGKRSKFAGLFDGSAPLAFTLSTKMNKQDIASAVGLFKTADVQLVKELVDKPAGKETKKGDDPTPSPFGNLINPLIETAKKGHADFFVQIVGQPPEKFAIVGGLSVADGGKLATGISDLLTRVSKREKAPEIKINAASHRGVNIHHVKFPRQDSPRNPLRRFFGDDVGLYVGVSRSVVWASIGGENALTQLKGTMDKLAAGASDRNDGSKAPIQFILNMASWVAMTGGDDGGRGGRGVAREAFSKGGDTLKVEIRPSETGIYARATLGEGFIKFVALGIHRQYQRSQERGR